MTERNTILETEKKHLLTSFTVHVVHNGAYALERGVLSDLIDFKVESYGYHNEFCFAAHNKQQMYRVSITVPQPLNFKVLVKKGRIRYISAQIKLLVFVPLFGREVCRGQV